MEHVFAVDLGGTQLRAALIRADGTIVAHQRTATLVDEGPVAVVGRILSLLAHVSREVPHGVEPRALGVGAPGPLDPSTGMVYSPPHMPGWDAFPLRAMLAEATGLAVYLGNDANAAALGEWRFGGGRGRRDLVYVTVSTGIGGGVISNGQLLLGRMGAAAELGFMLMDLEHGTVWEDLASGTAMARVAAQAMPEHPTSLLHHAATPATVTAAHVAAAATAGDALARSLMEREARLLGLGFASIMHLFSPELILVGGSVVLHNPDLLSQARAIAYTHLKVPLYRATPIELAHLGEQAGILGAAALAL